MPACPIDSDVADSHQLHERLYDLVLASQFGRISVLLGTSVVRVMPAVA